MKEYYDFLGLENKYNINDIILTSSKNREILLGGKFYYPIIETNINNKIIISCSPRYFENLKKYLKNIEHKDILEKFASKYLDKYEIKIMYRLAKDSEESKINCENVILIDESQKDFFYNIVKKEKNEKYKEEKWKEFNKIKAPYGINYGVIKDEKIVSLGYVSNVINNMANIVIQTEESYRNNGLASKVVEKISRKCLKRKLIPTYWVSKENIISQKVAKNDGFKFLAKEKAIFIN